MSMQCDGMMSLAALVLGSTLMVTAGTVDPLAPDPRAVKRAARAERRRHTAAVIKTVAGVGLEVGSALFYATTADSRIGRDVNLPPAGCNAPENPCRERLRLGRLRAKGRGHLGEGVDGTLLSRKPAAYRT
jgi:hypothetical protein